MWLNTNGIANLLSIPQCEKDAWVVDYNTTRNWVLISPQWKKIAFQKDTGVAEGVPFMIGMRNNHFEAALLQSIRKNFEGFTKRQVVKAVLACKA